jgi:hypothetical protein
MEKIIDPELEKKIKDWKEKYTFVYKMTLSGKDYYFRSLTRDDYFDILSLQSTLKDPRTFDHDHEVTKKCLLSDWTEDELSKKAGISTVLTERIMIVSGFEVSEVQEV